MLNWLSVQNLAIVQEAEVEFGSSFNAVTGETGAGKSVFMGALSLLFGARADKSAIRNGARQCEISAEFSIAPGTQPALRAILEENSLISPDSPDTILVRRVMTATSSRNFINGASVTLALLRTISSYLVDVHAANENASILDSANHLIVLDRFAGLHDECNAVRTAWEALAALRKEREQFAEDLPSPEEANRLRRDRVEIEQAGLHAGEDDELEARHTLAANAHTVLEIASATCSALTESEESLSSRLADCRRMLLSLDRIEPVKAGEFLTALDGIRDSIDGLSCDLASFADSVEINENDFNEMEARMRLIQTLKRRYGPTLDDVLEHLENLCERLNAFDDAALKRAEFDKQEKGLYEVWHKAAEELSAKRRQTARELEEVLSSETRKLGFLQASYHIEFSTAQDGANGFDHVEFLFSANPGMPLIPLRDVASSGEVARVMLAVKTVLANADDIPTLVFDEIDANIGGETACRVGEELALLGKSKQIISISHLAQVAVCADTHFRVVKSAEDNTTVSRIARLDDAARVKEIARMLGGGESALTHAADMLKKRKTKA